MCILLNFGFNETMIAIGGRSVVQRKYSPLGLGTGIEPPSPKPGFVSFGDSRNTPSSRLSIRVMAMDGSGAVSASAVSDADLNTNGHTGNLGMCCYFDFVGPVWLPRKRWEKKKFWFLSSCVDSCVWKSNC